MFLCLLMIPKSEVLPSEKPDLIIRKDLGSWIVDITCPYEKEKDSLNIAAKRKTTRYRSSRPTVVARHPGTMSCDLIPFVIGSRGAWSRGNEKLLKALKIKLTVWGKGTYCKHSNKRIFACMEGVFAAVMVGKTHGV